MRYRRARSLAACISLAVGGWALGQAAPATTQPAISPTTARAGAAKTDHDVLRLEPVIVTAQKRRELVQDVPQSITVIGSTTIEDAGITTVKEASYLAPNTVVSEFTNRRLSFPFVRGIGSGRNNPAVTTYIDGVPQLSYATSNQEMIDIDHIEFLRGPQGTLYGRNTLGGVINIVTKRPTNEFVFSPSATLGNYDLRDCRGSFSGPIVKDNLYIGLAGGYTAREGYTINTVTGHDLDEREDVFGRFQLVWTPHDRMDVRFTLSGERDRDGDYALGDLAAIRQTPHRVARDFEGSSARDILTPAVTVNYYGYAADFTSITAFQYWRSKDATDMDATPADLIRRTIAEDQRSFTQEFRLSSPQNKPVGLSRDLKLSWLVGAFFFKSGYDQRAFSDYLPGAVAALGLPFPFTQFENADLDDYGAAVFGQSTLSLFDKLDLTLGLRFDYESKNARLASFSSVPLMPATSQDADADFSRFLPRLGAAYHWTADLMTYATAAEGFKAGGFNTNAPAGKVPYDPETSWTYEIGLKQSFFKNRLIVNADAFYIEWNDLQLDVPTGAPGVFFLDNVGQATSKGLELEATVRPLDALELFTGLGYVNAEFARYTLPSGQRADGNDLPFAPHVTWNGGAEYSIRIADDLRLYARGEVVTIARYFYDASNTQGDGYSLASFRLGIGRKHWRLEGWVRNAFDEKYVPLALPFPLAPSGYIGESGEPRVYGVTLSMEF